MCNCKKQVINNLGIPSYARLAEQIYNEVKDLSYDEITQDQFDEMYRIYFMVYPKSNGTPDKTELVGLMKKIKNYIKHKK